MRFQCDAVVARATDGTPEARGVRWTEARTGVEGCFDMAATGCYYAGFLAVLGICLLRAGYRIPGRSRELTFWRDGLCYAPEGLSPLWASVDRLRRPHTEISSIEAEQISKPNTDQEWPGYTHGVRIVYKTGAIVHVARRLEPDSAHQLAVNLSLELRELRMSLSREALRARENPSSPSPRERTIE
jgi:hypothetical protein